MFPSLGFLWLFFFALFTGGPLLSKYLKTLKEIIERQKQVRLDIRPGSPEGLAGINMQELNEATRQLDSLGFTFQEDHLSRSYYSKDSAPLELAPPIASPSGSSLLPPERFPPKGFARVMVHPKYGCLGKILFVSVTDAQGVLPVATSMSVVVASFTGTTPNDWSYVTTNRSSGVTMNAIMKLMRHPRRLSTQMPAATPEQVLAKHLARREDVAKAAGISWKRSPNLADDYRIEELSTEHIRALFGSLSPLKMAWKLYWLKRETNGLEWQGELKGRLPDAS